VRLAILAAAVGAVVLLTGCDPSADFVFGHYENAGHEFVLDASSGPSGEHPAGTLEAEGQLFGTVGCLAVHGSEARVGLDLSPSIGLTALASVTGGVIRLSPPDAQETNKTATVPGSGSGTLPAQQCRTRSVVSEGGLEPPRPCGH
jgi:hypothetical protein